MSKNILVHQLAANHVSDDKVLDAIMCIDRELFVPASMFNTAAADSHIPLEVPHKFLPAVSLAGKMFQALNPDTADNLLVYHSSNGYLSFIGNNLCRSVTSFEPNTKLLKFQQTLLNLKPLNFITLTQTLNKIDDKFDSIIINGAVTNLPELTPYLKPGSKIIWCKPIMSANPTTKFYWCQLLKSSYNGENFNHQIIDEVNIYPLATTL